METVDLVTFTEEILNGKLHFLWSGASKHLFILLDLMLEKADIDMDDISEKLVKNENAWKEMENIPFYKTSWKIFFISNILKNIVWNLPELIPRPISQMDFYAKDYLVPFQTSVMEFLVTAQKMKFSIKDFFSKCDQIHRKLRIWSHLLKKSLMVNFIFCTI